jgi:tight adherence protein C
MFVLPIVGIGLAFGLAIYTVLSASAERATMRASLSQLDDFEIDNVRDQQLLNPLKDRTFKPVIERITTLSKRFTPEGYVDQVRTKFLQMGNASPDAIDRFMAIRLICLAALPLFLIWAWAFSGYTGMMKYALLMVGGIGLFKGPDIVVDRKVEDRQKQISRQLPDVLDLLVISVEAGLGFEQAIDRTVAAVPGPLTQEFNRMLGETRAGSSRSEALKAMDKRVGLQEMRQFVMAILQADTFGVSIGRILRSQADEMRIKRRQSAQERAMKAPVKMLLPMVFCIFPALFAITLGPAILNIMHQSAF